MKQRVRTISLRLLAVLIIASTLTYYAGMGSPAFVPAASASTPSYWPMFQKDAQHTSAAPYIASTDNSTRWIFGMGDAFRFSPVIDGSGVIFATGAGALYAINPDGSLKWSNRIFHPVSSPSIGADGTVYVPASKSIAAFYSSGVLKWNVSTAINLGASLTISPDGQIYSVNSGTLYSIYPNGQIRWSLQTNCQLSSAAIGLNGRIYCGGGRTLGGVLYSVDPVGAVVWAFSTGSNDLFEQAPTIGIGGTAYIPSGNGTLYALTSSGLLQWKVDVGATNSSVVVSPAGNIYAAGRNVSSIMSNGTTLWTENCYDQVTGSTCTPFGTVNGMALDSAGTLFLSEVLSNSSRVIALDADGSFKWSFLIPQGGENLESPPAIAPDGTMYYGTSCSSCGGNNPGHLYAFGRPLGEYLIAVGQSGLPNGTVWSISLDGATYQANTQTMIFSVAPGTHNWTPKLAGGQSGIRYSPVTPSGSITVPTSTAISISYNKQYEVVFAVSPSTGGNTTLQTQWFNPLSNVNVGAIASSNYQFGSWTSNSTLLHLGNTSAVTTSLLVNGTGRVTATFYPGFTIIAGIDGSVTYISAPQRGEVPPGTSKTLYVPKGSGVLLQADPNPGYVFSGWNEGSSVNTNPFITVLVNVPANVTATFSVQPIIVTSSSSTTTTSTSVSSTPTSTTTTTATSSSSSSTGIPASPKNLSLYDYELIAGAAILVLAVGYIFIRRRRRPDASLVEASSETEKKPSS